MLLALIAFPTLAMAAVLGLAVCLREELPAVLLPVMRTTALLAVGVLYAAALFHGDPS